MFDIRDKSSSRTLHRLSITMLETPHCKYQTTNANPTTHLIHSNQQSHQRHQITNPPSLTSPPHLSSPIPIHLPKDPLSPIHITTNLAHSPKSHNQPLGPVTLPSPILYLIYPTPYTKSFLNLDFRVNVSIYAASLQSILGSPSLPFNMLS